MGYLHLKKFGDCYLRMKFSRVDVLILYINSGTFEMLRSEIAFSNFIWIWMSQGHPDAGREMFDSCRNPNKYVPLNQPVRKHHQELDRHPPSNIHRKLIFPSIAGTNVMESELCLK